MNISRLNGDVYLSVLNLAGTHDSATAYVAMEKVCRCQRLTIAQQLGIGVRLFDIRLFRKGGDFYLCHAIADCFTDSEKKERLSFDSLLELFYAFLKENPDEVLVVSVKQDRGIKLPCFFSAFFNKYIKDNEEKWFLENRNPTLSECRGKIVLMRRCIRSFGFRDKSSCGLDFSHWRDQASKRKFHPRRLVLKKGLTAMIQDRYGLSYYDKWEKSAKPFLDSCETSRDKFAIHFISTAFREKGADLTRGAEEINGKFAEYTLGKNRGWIFVDFADEKIISKIMNSNMEETK